MFRSLTPSSEQVDSLEAQFNEPDADIDNGDGRSFVTRQGFLVTSEVPEGFDVGPDEFVVVEARDGFPSVLILGQNQLVAPFIAGLEEIDFQQEIGLANTLFDQARNNGGSNIRDVDPNDIDEVADLFVGSDILEAGPDAGRLTAVDPTPEQFDAILESLQEDGGLTPGGFAAGPLPRVLENLDNPDPNQLVLTPAGTTSDGQQVPTALFVENLNQVAVFNAALEDAGLGDAEINNLVNNVFNPIRNNQLEEFDADVAADISILFDGADVVNGGDIGNNGVDVGDNDNDAADDGDVAIDDGNDVVDEAPVVNNGVGGAEFIRFDANADELSIIRDALETGDTAGISVDNFAVGEIPAPLRDSGNPNAVLITEGGIDAQGNDVPPSLLFDPAVLQRQANIRIAAEENFPDDAETRNLIQRQFDQVRNDNLRPFDDQDDVGDVTAIFDGLNLPSIGDGNAEAGGVVEVDDGNDGRIVGDGDANTLIGDDDGNNTRGRGGDDTINGNGGNDRLAGNQGSDVLTGGDGADRFVVARDFGAGTSDRITDFNVNEDRLIFRNVDRADNDISAYDVIVTSLDDGSGVQIDVAGGETVILEGVGADDIDANDNFVFDNEDAVT